MSEDASQSQLLEASFITWHNSNGDVHIRTDEAVLYISKKSTELVALAQKLSRGQRIRAKGVHEFSKTLSTHVFTVAELETV